MGLRINTNVHALNAQRHLAASTRALGRVYGQLASGRRLAVAADDPAGLGIANRMTATVRSLKVARDNVLDGANLLDVAEGALAELNEIIGRTRELMMQAANGTLSDDDRRTIETERAQLAEEAVRVIEVTSFNGTSLFGSRFDPQIVTVPLQVGPDEGDSLDVSLPDAMRIAVALDDISALTIEDAQDSFLQLDISNNLIARDRGSLGSTRRRLETAARNLATERENTAASRSRIEDLDFAVAAAERARTEILQSASTTILSQANVQPQLALTLLGGGAP